MTRAYEYHHVVTFEETNLTGNVYYAHYVRWQGMCREMFLRDNAPEVLAEMERDLVLRTVRCSCNYGIELRALDTVVIRMRLVSAVWNRVALEFEYLRHNGERLEQVAAGEQEIACLRRDGESTVETEIPRPLLDALEPYREDAP